MREQKRKKIRERGKGGVREFKKIKPRESMTHQLITKILLLSKEKTGLKQPIKERMKGNLLLLIHRGSAFEVLHDTYFFTF